MSDWEAGHYELTALQLEPVARRVVSLARVLPDESVLDIACGTGNGSLEAARAGASVTGLDLARRLLEVASGRAAAENLSVSYVLGDAQHLSFPDHSFDLVLSIFGVIFAPDAEKAFGEIVRVLRPSGRALLSVWVPGSTVDQMVGVFVGAVRKEVTAPSAPGFEWHSSTAVSQMAARHDVSVLFHEGQLNFSAESAEDYLSAIVGNHPMFVTMRTVLEAAGSFEGVRAQALRVLQAGNQDPHRFLVTSPYRVLEVRARHRII